MVCPGCRSEDDKVVDSRFTGESNAIRRRRECLACGFRYTTYERTEDSLMQVVKSDGVRQTWDRKKVLEGVRKAAEKRPIDTEQLETLVDNVQRAAFRVAAGGEISTTKVGGLVMEQLRGLDAVAYVRFASVYMDFKDVEEFVNAIDALRADAADAAEGVVAIADDPDGRREVG